MTSPTISVLMPVYNAERYVAEAVESILAQTFTDFELLIVDDGSTDRSLEILQRYADADSRIHLRSRPNTGLVGALNEMLAAARGEYIARMDADDICYESRFAEQRAFLQENPDVVAVGSAFQLIDPIGTPITTIYPPTSHEKIEESLWRGNAGVLPHPALFARRATLESVGGYAADMETSEDRDLYFRLGEVGRLTNVPTVLLKYRQHLQNTNNTRSKRRLALQAELYRRVCQRRGLTEVPFAYEPPRVRSAAEQLTSWGWCRLREGRRMDAIKVAMDSLLRTPTHWSTWKLLACSIRGR